LIPFFAPEPVVLGPLTLSWWLIFVVIGIVVGTEFGLRRAKREGLSIRLTVECTVAMVGLGFVVARLFTLFVYGHGDGWRDLDSWGAGYSSVGGFVGAAIAIPVYLKLYRKAPIWGYLDNAAIGFLLGWAFGRVGCSLAHDHVGRATTWITGIDFPLDWPNPGSQLGLRHDLGLYEAVLCFAIVALMVALDRRHRPHGFFSVLSLFTYAPGRFLLDFLRAEDLEHVAGRTSDVRMAGLTPAQYGCLALMTLGVWMYFFRRGKGRDDLSDQVARYGR